MQNKAALYGLTSCSIDAACVVATENGVSAKQDLTLQPNPTSDVLTLKTSLTIEKCEIYDALGRVVQTSGIQGQAISVAHLPKGSYSIKVFGADGFAVKQFVKF